MTDAPRPRFVLNGAVHEAAAPPSTTMLDYLREHLRLTGTKEGCAEGDCGACTVVRVVAGEARPRHEAVNACLMQIGQADGTEILTVEGLSGGGGLTPVQDAMASGDGTQCGFCTPGFVCALYALAQSDERLDDGVIHDALAGNLCRCTGYRPIVDAARTACAAETPRAPSRPTERSLDRADSAFLAPGALDELVRLRARYPDSMLLAGGTDLGLSVSKARARPEMVLHTARVAELREIVETEDAVSIGAAATYSEALPYLDRLYPSFARLVRRIGSRQIRNLGTFGGNIGTASPIGDTLPCLIALDATLTLESAEGRREIPVDEFFVGYRQTALGRNEVIRSIRVPKLSASQAFRTYKVSRRYDQDISSVIGAFRVACEGEAVIDARIAYGGMAATPARAHAAEAALTGESWSEESAVRAGSALDFAPIDDHRASASYRMRVASNLLVRLWRDLSGAEADLEVTSL